MKSINTYIHESFYGNVNADASKYTNIGKEIACYISDLKKNVHKEAEKYRKQYPTGDSYYISPLYSDLCEFYQECIHKTLLKIDVPLRIAFRVNTTSDWLLHEYHPEMGGWIMGYRDKKSGDITYDPDVKDITKSRARSAEWEAQVIIEDSEYGENADFIKKTIKIEMI